MIENEPDYRRRIVVKFQDDVDMPYEDDIGGYVDKNGIGPWNELAEAFAGIVLVRLFTTLEPQQINDLVKRGMQQDRTYSPPNFLTYFAIYVTPEIEANALTEELNSWITVETAYVEMRQAPGPVDPTNDPYATDTLQGHLNAAPEGIGVRELWRTDLYPGLVGNDGADIQLVDIEKGWNYTHDDFGSIEFVLPGHNRKEFQHGTNSLGVVAARDNGIGVIGVAPNVIAKVLSIYRTDTAVYPDRPDAILTACDSAILTFGDVMLLEIQVEELDVDGSGLLLRWPVEVEKATFETIRLATALGIVVVEAAGTATPGASGPAQDLADYFVEEAVVGVLVNKHILNRVEGNDYFRDSGAIMVSGATKSDPHIRHTNSNYGNRIDCYAWGEGVGTADTNNTGTTSTYYFLYSGTSSAAAIIAGAAAVVQSLAEKNHSYRLGAFHMRRVLSNLATGTLAGAASEPIGVMPNLEAIFNVLHQIPDLLLRDYVGDTGAPHSGPISNSPDIIVRPAVGPGSVGNKDAEFGTGSGTMDVVPVGSEVRAGQDHQVFVRARNRGGVNAADAVAKVYYSTPSTLILPADWIEIGKTNPTVIPVGTSIITVFDPIDWAAAELPAPGHYCFIATIGNVDDPDPIPNPDDLVLDDFADYYRIIRRNNNITWRNFNVLPVAAARPAPMMMRLPFIIPGTQDKDRKMQFEAIAQLPEASRLSLEGPIEFMKKLFVEGQDWGKGERENFVKISIDPQQVTKFRDAVLMAKDRHEMLLLVELPEVIQPRNYDVFVRHLYRGREVGRITWRIWGVKPG